MIKKHDDMQDQSNIHKKLLAWRQEQAHVEGVECFRILTNQVLSDMALNCPKTDEDLVKIKGFKEKKLVKYGKAILAITQEKVFDEKIIENIYASNGNEQLFTVDEYLNTVNNVLHQLQAGIRGEINSIDCRERYLFFTLKDAEKESVIACFMWKSNYDMCGVNIDIGSEVIVRGFSEVYKPNGKMSFRAYSIEYVGEGMLKKEYDRLRLKLESEGLFDDAKKRVLKPFPEKVGLITSRDGAVIHDFLNNIGKYGYCIQFINSRVEGQSAVYSLIRAIQIFQKKSIDALVIIRGGGSLESLQAFNNENIVREIAKCNFPVICGIGHHTDMPLASLSSDIAVSTPTAAAHILNSTWEHAEHTLKSYETTIREEFTKCFIFVNKKIQINTQKIQGFFKFSLERCRTIFQNILQNARITDNEIQRSFKYIVSLFHIIESEFHHAIKDMLKKITYIEEFMKSNDPHRLLNRGFSIVLVQGKILHSIRNLRVHQDLEIIVRDGNIGTTVRTIKNNQEKNKLNF